ALAVLRLQMQKKFAVAPPARTLRVEFHHQAEVAAVIASLLKPAAGVPKPLPRMHEFKFNAARAQPWTQPAPIAEQRLAIPQREPAIPVGRKSIARWPRLRLGRRSRQHEQHSSQT